MLELCWSVAAMQERIEDEKRSLMLRAPSLHEQREVFNRVRIAISKIMVSFEVLIEWCFHQ